MTIIILVGSVGAGKTTLSKVLRIFLSLRKSPIRYRYVEININHGFAYLLTRFLAKILRYRYISNYYWTLRFNNFGFFCKYLRIMMILDAIYAPIKILTSIVPFELFCRMTRKKYLIVLDEYYITAIAEYMYHLLKSCRIQSRILKVFYNVAFRIVLNTLKRDKIVIVCLYTSLNNSIKASILRDRTRIIDIQHLIYKNVYIRVLINALKEYQSYLGNNIEIRVTQVENFPNNIIEVSKILLAEHL